MNRFLRGKVGGGLAFLIIAALVIGGLAQATFSALRLEAQQRATAQQSELAEKMRLALWRLDSRLSPTLAREDSRPSVHYTVLHAPLLALKNTGATWTGGQVWLPSPLLNAELPEWMLLHFQLNPAVGWQSPQVISDELAQLFRQTHAELRLSNVTPERKRLLKTLGERFPPKEAVAQCELWDISPPEQRSESPSLPLAEPPISQPSPFQQAIQVPNQSANSSNTGRSSPLSNLNLQSTDQDFNIRQQLQTRGMTEGKAAYQNDLRNYPSVIFPNTKDMKEILAIEPPVDIRLGSMKPVWFNTSVGTPEYLLYVRLAEIGSTSLYQGVVLDWGRVREELLGSIFDLFPEADLKPLSEGEPTAPERSMTTLPIELLHGPLPEPIPTGWSAVRVGLAFAWIAALIALTAVGLGGWSLIELSERRIRFVSAVTHELRTPLTTLRLYLDLLTSGMVTDEKHRAEYLTTLHTESDRLHRLIGNVLDFARLEKQRPQIQMRATPIEPLLEQIRLTWVERCAADGKELVIENHLPPGADVTTDENLFQQIIGNLVDNARKYTRSASDPRIWVRAGKASDSLLYIEVEDRGPGIPTGERATIFRPFCRGHDADVTAGGVGLGLALARRWATLLGGKLHLEKGEAGIGARFRLELPVLG